MNLVRLTNTNSQNPITFSYKIQIFLKNNNLQE